MTPKRLASILLLLSLIAVFYFHFTLGLCYLLATSGVFLGLFSVLYLAICVTKGHWIGPKRLWKGFKEFLDFLWN